MDRKAAVNHCIKLYKAGLISDAQLVKDILVVLEEKINNEEEIKEEEKNIRSQIEHQLYLHHEGIITFGEMKDRILHILKAEFEMKFFLDPMEERTWYDTLNLDHKAQYKQQKMAAYLQAMKDSRLL